MNAQPDGQVAQATARGGGLAGRRGGGRGSGNRSAATKGTVAKAPVSKIGPTRLLETEWIKDSLLKEDCFVIWIGSGKAGDQQWTVHRPIGETRLAATSWVMTPGRDLGYLLARRESEELSSWKRKAEFAKKQAVLQSRMGRKMEGQTEVWSFDGAPAIQPTIRTCMAAAKAAGKQESTWLDYADSAVQAAERSFKEALRTQAIPEAWAAENPRPKHETMGGPLGDARQKEVNYLRGLTFNAAKDKVLRVILSIDSNESDDEDDEELEQPPPLRTPSPPAKQEKKTPTPSASPKK